MTVSGFIQGEGQTRRSVRTPRRGRGSFRVICPRFKKRNHVMQSQINHPTVKRAHAREQWRHS